MTLSMHDSHVHRDSLRVAVIGVGRFGALHARVWREAGADLVGFVDQDPSRLNEVSQRFGVHATNSTLGGLLQQTHVDVVVVTSDEASHAELAQHAICNGAHVFVEKPLALSAGDAWAVYKLARQFGREVVVGQISRFVPALKRMRDQIVAGRIGTLAAVRLRRDFSRSWFLAFGDRVHPVWESCIHDIDLAVFLDGGRVERVSAMQSLAAGQAAPSVVSAHLQMASGVLATVESAWLLPPQSPQTMSGALELDGTIVAEAEALGMDGVLRQRQLSDKLMEWTSEGTHAPDLTLWPEAGGQVGGALRAEIDYAMAVFSGERPVNDLIPLEEACWGVEAAEALVRSLAEGRPVEISQAGGGWA